jgi:D-arabinose 1-dehydrogenase-like Zn-dependent alcohol dehydrogenase
LGAHIYIDSTTQDFAAELQKLGGATVILSTLTNAESLTQAVGGLGPNGKLIIVGVPDKPFEVSVIPLVMGTGRLTGGLQALEWTQKIRSTSARWRE